MNTHYENILKGKSDEELLILVKKMNETAIEQNLYDEAGLYDLTRNCCRFVEKMAKIPFLGEAAVTINLFCGMLMDSIKGSYNITVKTRTTIIGALAYLVMPVDLIPDAIPFFGILDDARVLMLAGTALRDEVENYKSYLLRKNYEDFCESVNVAAAERFYGDTDESIYDNTEKEVA